MGFVLERQFIDPYPSGGDGVNSTEGSRVEEESSGVKYLTVVPTSGENAVTISMLFINDAVSTVIIKSHPEDVPSCSGAKSA